MTHRPNPVQSISQQRQQFSQAQFQPQQLMGQQPQQPTAEAAIQAQMHELSLEIYARLVSGSYLDSNSYSALDQERLSQLAGQAQTAARAYFEQLGVQFREEQTHGQS